MADTITWARSATDQQPLQPNARGKPMSPRGAEAPTSMASREDVPRCCSPRRHTHTARELRGEQKRFVREAKALGISQVRIAKELGISEGRVSQILKEPD